MTFFNWSYIDVSEPLLVSSVPAMNGELDPSSDIQLVFSKNIYIASNWTAFLTCNSETIDIPSDVPLVTDNVLSIGIDLPSYIFCVLTVEELSIIDYNGNEYTEEIILSFNTKDIIAPVVTFGIRPITDLTEASRISEVVLSIDDQTPVELNSAIDGGVTVRTSSEIFFYTVDKLSIVDNTIIIPNEAVYPSGEIVTVNVPEGLIKDQNGNLNTAGVYSFTVTTIATKPSAVSLVSNTLFTSDNLQIRFDSTIAVGSGMISLQGVQVNSMISIDVATCEVEETLLRCPFADAVEGAEYSVTLNEGVVMNILGNGNAQATMEETAFIYSLQVPSLIMEECYPSENGVTVPLNATVELKWNQPVTLKSDCSLQVSGYETPSSLHTVELIHEIEGSSVTHTFSATDLLAFTQYTLTIPANCFANSMNVGNELISYSFTTTRTEAPALVTFNLEGQQDVLLDASMVFTFSQPLALSENAVILVKPRDEPSVERSVSLVEGNSFTIYNQDASLRFASKTQYTVYIPEGTICNSDGLCMEAMTLTPFTTVVESVTRVILQHTVPSSGATQVSGSAPVVLRFTGNVRAATGATQHYYIHEGENRIEGTAQFNGREVSLLFPLESGKTYTYVYDENLFTTNKGSPVHYDIGSSFSFTVADTEGPTHYSFTVSNNMGSVEILFNENVVSGTGLLTITNSAEEAVLAPITANIASPDNRLVIYISGQTLPDDVYTFNFAAGFVKDIYGNESPAFTEVYALDRVAFEVTEVKTPTTAFDSITIVLSKPVSKKSGEIILDGTQRCVVAVDSLPSELTEVTIVPSVCGASSWESGSTYTMTIGVSVFEDEKGNQLASMKVAQIVIPALVNLEVADESFPAMNSIISVNDLLSSTIVIVFQNTIEVTSSLQLINGEGCILATDSSMHLNDTSIVVDSVNSQCMEGTVYLIAGEGAIISREIGAKSAASTVALPLYTFSFMAKGPAPVAAAAVYKNGLMITANARIDITFNMELSASSSTLTSLSFLKFLDNDNNEVELAERIHGEIEGRVLRVVVDEPFSPIPTTQIRSVVITPVERDLALSTEGTDVAAGSVALSRLFSLPPVSTEVHFLNNINSIRPTVEIVFDQDVQKIEGTCAALLVSNSIATVSVSIEALTVVDAKHFTWTPSVTELLLASTEYTFVVDNSCFIVTESQTPSGGASNAFIITTPEDTFGPVVLGAFAALGDEPSNQVVLETTEFFVAFNEAVTINESGVLYFMSEENNEVVQIPASLVNVDGNVARVNIAGRLLSNVAYNLRIENAFKDLAGNAMEVMTQSIRLTTALSIPRPVNNVNITPLETGSLLISFDASLDMNLKTPTGPCRYYLKDVANQNIQISFDDVCVGPTYQGEHPRLSFIKSLVDPQALNFFIVASSNGIPITSENNFVYVTAEGDSSPINQPPAVPKLLAIQSIRRMANERRATFYIEQKASYSRITSYTFIVKHEESTYSYHVEATPMSSVYSIDIPAFEKPISIAVKSSTGLGSSAFSESLVIPNPSVESTVPGLVSLDSIVSTQLSANTVSVSWNAPADREAIQSYKLYFADEETMTVTEPSAIVTAKDNAVEFDLAAVNMVGEGERVHVRIDVDSHLSASVASVSTGSTYAIATFETSFSNVNVECALNAGQLIHAIGSVIGEKQVRVVINGLIPSFHYSGLCWAYGVESNSVSDSISLSFTTAAVTEQATLSVSDFVFQTRSRATLQVNIDIPATVYCTVAPVEAVLVHSDIMAYGTGVEVTLDGPKTLDITYTESDAARVFCTAENSMQKKVGSIVTLDVPSLPFTAEEVDVVFGIENGNTDVSVKPVLSFMFTSAPVVSSTGSLTIENMETHKTMVIPSEQFVVFDVFVEVRVPSPLEHNTRYTYYTSGNDVITVNNHGMRRILYGEIQFTTSSIDTAPELLTSLVSIDPSSEIAIEFERNLILNDDKEIVILVNNHRKAVSVSVEEYTLHVTVDGLIANTAYTLVIGECAVEDIYGNCVPEKRIAVETMEDLESPVVSYCDVADKTNVPNDLPIHLQFSEVVRLNNINHIAVLANNNVVTLYKHNIVVDGREVTIQLDRGYSMGSRGLDAMDVKVIIEEDAFRDLAGHGNEFYEASFTAVPQRCGSSFLSTFMEDGCRCHSEGGKCWCSCGLVNLFEL